MIIVARDAAGVKEREFALAARAISPHNEAIPPAKGQPSMRATFLALLLSSASVAAADAPCVSGPKAGQRPGPYSFVLCTGEQRGKSHCFICETAERPAVIVFARNLSDPLGKLAAGLDKAFADNKKIYLRAWVTLLHEDQSKIDDAVLGWAKKHAVKAT